MKEDIKLGRGWRALAITEMIRNGKREFTLIEAVDYCYPKAKDRPKHVGRSVASTLRLMMDLNTKDRKLYRRSGLGRGHKGIYMAVGKGWTK